MNQPTRRIALRAWIESLTSAYADRIHPVDVEVAVRAGALLSALQGGVARHRFHDAVLLATAQIHGHGLLTRRDAVFGPRVSLPDHHAVLRARRSARSSALAVPVSRFQV